MADEGVPHLLAVEDSHSLDSVVTYSAVLPSQFCDRYFHQLDATLAITKFFILSCSNHYVGIIYLKLETVSKIPNKLFSIKQVQYREFQLIHVIDSDYL